MKKTYIRAALLALCCCPLAACGREAVSYEIAAVSEVQGETAVSSADQESGDPEPIFVYICGAVRSPGVYELPRGSRVFSAVEAAGGMTEEADSRLLNQAGILEDGQQITVYTKAEAESLPSQEQSARSETAGKVNLNTASMESLMTLPGIGEAKARAILNYREEQGGFQSIEEIQQVEGIKEKVYEKIKEQIEV